MRLFILTAILAAFISHSAVAQTACITELDMVNEAHAQGVQELHKLSASETTLILSDMAKDNGLNYPYTPTAMISFTLSAGVTRIVVFHDGCAEDMATTTTANYKAAIGDGA